MTLIALRGKKGVGKDTVAELMQSLRFHPARPVLPFAFAGPIKSFCGYVYGLPQHVLYGPSALRDELIPYSAEQSFAAYRRARSRVVLQFETWGKLLNRDLLPALPAFWRWQEQISEEISRAGWQLSPRHVLQTFGTEFAREQFGPDVWAELTLSRISYHQRRFGDSDFVITDCRFDNETQAVHAEHGRVWEIVDPDAFETEQRARAAGAAIHASEAGCTIPADVTIYNRKSAGKLSLRTTVADLMSKHPR